MKYQNLIDANRLESRFFTRCRSPPCSPSCCAACAWSPPTRPIRFQARRRMVARHVPSADCLPAFQYDDRRHAEVVHGALRGALPLGHRVVDGARLQASGRRSKKKHAGRMAARCARCPSATRRKLQGAGELDVDVGLAFRSHTLRWPCVACSLAPGAERLRVPCRADRHPDRRCRPASGPAPVPTTR